MCALVCTLLSLFVRGYEKLFDPKQVAHDIDETHPDEAAFLADRIADLTVASQRDGLQNDRRALWLQRAGIILLAGFLFSLVFLILVGTIPASSQSQSDSSKSEIGNTSTVA